MSIKICYQSNIGLLMIHNNYNKDNDIEKDKIKNDNKKYKCYCTNCAITGKTITCKTNVPNIPITSIGVIAYYYDKSINDFKFLIIKRRDSLGYVDFLRGKYKINNISHIQNLFNEMTNKERDNILKEDFETLWKRLWDNEKDNIDYKLKCKFDTLKNSVNNNIELKTLINNVSYNWSEPEWGFPKGKKNYNEKDYNAAVREFNEETGIPIQDIEVIQNIKPFEECFIGSNYKAYKHKYYLAKLKKKPLLDNYQRSEVSEQGLYTKNDIVNKFRFYNKEKISLLELIYDILHKYDIQ